MKKQSGSSDRSRPTPITSMGLDRPTKGNEQTMKLFLLRLIGTAAILAPIGIATAGERPGSMSAFLWKFRPVLVFAPTAEHPIVNRQTSLLKGKSDELADREILLIIVTGRNVSIDGKPASHLSAERVRARYGVSGNEAASLLVGKDGGVKLKSGRALPSSALFSTIDAMPMRKEEMRQRNQ